LTRPTADSVTVPPISIALPVHHAPDTLSRAVGCLTRQTLPDLDIMIVLNGSDDGTFDVAAMLAGGDSRIRILRLPEANLSNALNAALREARHDLVARMDADDECSPDRLEHQTAVIADRADLAALGSGWMQLTPDGDLRAIIRPPVDPREARWRLLTTNPFAHGSMLLRRREIIAAGGYDPRRVRAQDYDLWLRLARRNAVAAIPDVLYTFHLRDHIGHSASPEQATHSAELLLNAWSNLPARGTAPTAALLARALAAKSRPEALSPIEEALTEHGPSRDLVDAWFHVQTVFPQMPSRAASSNRESRVREVISSLQSHGVDSLHVWGAGTHTAWLVPRLLEAGIRVLSIIDDLVQAESHVGLPVRRPDRLSRGEHVLLSSEAHEDALLASAAPHKRRGVLVHSFYSEKQSMFSAALSR
jgi:hypothetical protein